MYIYGKMRGNKINYYSYYILVFKLYLWVIRYLYSYTFKNGITKFNFLYSYTFKNGITKFNFL